MNDEFQQQLNDSNYYSIITMDVLLDKKLSDKSKLVYAELTSLVKKCGYAYCSNNYLAKLFDIHPITISKCIKELKDNGYIDCEYTEENARKIFITNLLVNSHRPISETAKTSKSNDLDPISEIANKESIVKNNNLEIIDKNNICATSETEVAPTPTKYKFNCKPSKKNGATEYILSQEDLDIYLSTYPNLDIDQELKKMWIWLKNNNLKTYNGMGRFISSWLARANDRQPSNADKDLDKRYKEARIKEIEHKTKNNIEKTHEMFEKAENFMNFFRR